MPCEAPAGPSRSRPGPVLLLTGCTGSVRLAEWESQRLQMNAGPTVWQLRGTQAPELGESRCSPLQRGNRRRHASRPTPQHCSEDQKDECGRVLCKFQVPYKYELLLFPAGLVWDYFNEGVIND